MKWLLSGLVVTMVILPAGTARADSKHAVSKKAPIVEGRRVGEAKTKIDYSTEAKEGWNECWIAESRDRVVKGYLYYREATGSIPVKRTTYYTRTARDCELLAQQVQSEREPKKVIPLTGQQAGSRMGRVSAATFTDWQFNDNLIWDSKGRVYSSDIIQSRQPANSIVLTSFVRPQEEP